MKNLKLVLLIFCVIVVGVAPLYAAPERVTLSPVPGQSPKINSNNKPMPLTLSEALSARNYTGIQSLNSATIGPNIALEVLDPYEPNDDPANAKRIPYNSTIAATIESATDIDFYIQSFIDGRTIELSLKNIPTNCNYNLYLVAPDGDTIIASSENGGNADELIQGTISGTGDLFVVVLPVSGFSDTAQYSLYSGDISPVVLSVPWITTHGIAGYEEANTDYYSIPLWAVNAKLVFDWQYYGRGPDEVGVYTDRQIYWNSHGEATPTTFIGNSGHVEQSLTPGQSIRVHLYYVNYSEIVGPNNAVWANGITISCEYPQPNAPPALDPIGNKTVAEGELLQFTVNATDIDKDPLTYSASGLPTGATFDPATRVFSWTPDYNQAGLPSPQVTFSVSDGNGGVDSEIITITVTDTP